MKKILIIVFISFLCFGCSKDNKNIVINIYENSDTQKTELKENNGKEIITKEIVINKDSDNSEKESKEGKNSKINSLKDKVKETYNSAKTWYDNNKDELKNINDELLQESIDTITNTTNKAKTWYDDNKDVIKDKTQEKYNSAKQYLKNLFLK